MINFMQSSYFGSRQSIDLGSRQSVSPDLGARPSVIKMNNARPVSSHEWAELTRQLQMPDQYENTIKYITNISLTHNMHKKQILIGYMNYIIRKYPHLITTSRIDVFENVAHSSDDIPCDDLVAYFVSNIFNSGS